MNQPSVQPSDRTDVRILVADDSRINRLLARKLLTRAGYRTDVVDNGQQAIDSLLTGEIFDLVLMDCRMPVMDGPEATRTIRTLQSNGRLSKHLPIVAVSSLDFEEADEELPFGMDGYLVKPYEENDLLEVVAAFTTHLNRESKSTVNVAPISTESLLELCGGEREIATDLLGTFIEDGDLCISKMRNGLHEIDIQKVNAAAHSLKGASSMLTATAVTELSRRIEDSQEISEQLKQLVDQLDVQFEKCRRFKLT